MKIKAVTDKLQNIATWNYCLKKKKITWVLQNKGWNNILEYFQSDFQRAFQIFIHISNCWLLKIIKNKRENRESMVIGKIRIFLWENSLYFELNY